MPTFVHGKSTAFKMDDSGGTVRVLTTYLDSVDMPFDVDTAETTTFSAASKTHIAGTKGSSITLNGKQSFTSDAVLNNVSIDALLYGVLGMEVTFVYGPSGLAGSEPRYHGQAIVTAYNPSSSVSGEQTFSVSLLCTGDITRATTDP